MNRKWKIGEAFGIGVYVHWTFLILLAWALLSSLAQGEGLGAAVFAAGFVGSIFACVVFHEFGHALMARRFGIGTRDITLYPIGGVARLDRLPDRPRQELLVALAGPAVNLAIAVGLFGMLLAVNESLGGAGGLMGRLVAELGIGSLLGYVVTLIWANLVLAGFNLLPAFPMDGGRVLRAFLAGRVGQLRATEIAARVGKYMALLLGIAGLWIPQYLLIVLAGFVYLMGQQELAAVRWRFARPTGWWPATPTVIDVTARPVESSGPRPSGPWIKVSGFRPLNDWPNRPAPPAGGGESGWGFPSDPF